MRRQPRVEIRAAVEGDTRREAQAARPGALLLPVVERAETHAEVRRRVTTTQHG